MMSNGSNDHGSRLLHTSRASFVLRDIEQEDELFPVLEQTVADPVAGLQSIEQRVIYKAACSHLVGFQSPAEIAGTCDLCGGTCCYRCQARCHECLRQLCPEHVRILEGSLYCPRCAVRQRAKRIGSKAMRLLHAGLSKDL